MLPFLPAQIPKSTRSEVLLRWLRRAVWCTFIVSFAVASVAIAEENRDRGASWQMWAFAATWIGMLLNTVGTYLTIRRDRNMMQDRVDKRTVEVFREVTSAREWREDRDERTREITRDLLLREFKIESVATKVDETSKRVEALSEHVREMRKEFSDDVRHAVSKGVREASVELLKGMIMPNRER